MIRRSNTYSRAVRQRIGGLWLSSLVGLIVFSGCGKAPELVRVPVTGTVAIEGDLLPEGTIRFVPLPETNSPLVEGQVKDGLFDIPRESGPIVGKYKIEVVPKTAETFALDDEAAYAAKVKEQGTAPAPSAAAPKFANPTEELIAEVKADALNHFSFQLRHAK